MNLNSDPAEWTRRHGIIGVVPGRGGRILALQALARSVVQLHHVVRVDMAVPTATGYNDERSSREWHELIPAGVEHFDRDRALENKQQLVGIGVHLPRSGSAPLARKTAK
jgi:hypothetical protein